MRPGIVAIAMAASILAACAGARVEPLEPAAATGEPADAAPEVAPPVMTTATPLRDIRPGERPGPDSDEAGLWMLMERWEEQLKTAGNVERDPALNAYVRRIACRIAGPYCGDIRPYIVRRAAFNATMGPNGVLVIWTGALLRFRNEAQLAAVLGHEIGHYIRRHSLQRMRDVSAKAGFLNVFSIGAIFAGVPIASDVAHLAILGAIFAFSRDNEREADETGIELMAKIGYDPREAAKVWQQLIDEEDADKDASRPSIFFATHPPPRERLKTLRRRAEALSREARATETGGARFRRVVGPHYRRFLRDELRQRRFARLDVVLARLRADGVGAGTVRFFEGELYRIRDDAKDGARALDAYRKALGAGDAPPRIHRSVGLVHRKAGRTAEARRAFAEYLRRLPGAADRDIIRAMMAKGR